MFDIPIENKTKPALDLGLGNSQPTQQPQYQQQQYHEPIPQPMQQPNYQEPIAQQGVGMDYSLKQQMVQQPRPQGGGVVLAKGQKVSLSKMNPNLNEIMVGLGWDLGPNGQGYDLDVEAFMLGVNGKVIGDDWFVFYNQPSSPDGSVRHLGDNRTGAGSGDDEVIEVSLSRVNTQVAKIVFVVTINEALQRGHNFGGVSNAYIRVVDKSTNNELVRFNLTEYYKEVTSMMVGELYLHNGEWRFNPVGNGVALDLLGLCQMYGVNVSG